MHHCEGSDSPINDVSVVVVYDEQAACDDASVASAGDDDNVAGSLIATHP